MISDINVTLQKLVPIIIREDVNSIKYRNLRRRGGNCLTTQEAIIDARVEQDLTALKDPTLGVEKDTFLISPFLKQISLSK